MTPQEAAAAMERVVTRLRERRAPPTGVVLDLVLQDAERLLRHLQSRASDVEKRDKMHQDVLVP